MIKQIIAFSLLVILSSETYAQETGKASFYWQGQKTASGERFNPNALTAAHRYYPFNSYVKVTNVHNGATVIVRINDRGPFVRGRIIDVSRGAANQLKMIKSGVIKVKIEKM